MKKVPTGVEMEKAHKEKIPAMPDDLVRRYALSECRDQNG